jgi:hypothetical protein
MWLSEAAIGRRAACDKIWTHHDTNETVTFHDKRSTQVGVHNTNSAVEPLQREEKANSLCDNTGVFHVKLKLR